MSNSAKILTILRRLRLNKPAKIIVSRLIDLAELTCGEYRTPRTSHPPHRIDILRGRYEPAETNFLTAAAEHARTIFDIGANLGYFTRRMGKACLPHGGRVIAFEPNPSVFRFLQRNTRELPNVLCLPLGVSSQPGINTLHILNDDAALGSLSPEVAKVHSTDQSNIAKQSVHLAQGGMLMAALGFPAPELIKIDVEGWEMSVLRSFDLSDPKWGKTKILFELNPLALQLAGSSLDELIYFWPSVGFRLNSLALDGSLKPVNKADVLATLSQPDLVYTSLVACASEGAR